MRSIAIVLCLVVAAACAPTLEQEWSEFKVKHNKQYKTKEEELFRKKLFEKSKNEVEEHNKKYEQGLTSYTIGINKFSDMTTEELQTHHNCFNNVYRNSTGSSNTRRTQFVSLPDTEVPDELDWRTKGAVSPVKDQGYCGSCWAFSTTGAVEAHHFIETGKMVQLSEQNLVDCAIEDGCRGGLADIAFDYIINNNGIDTEDSYPYEGREGACRYNQETSGATVSSYVDVPKYDEEELKKAVNVGPVAVAIDASDINFKKYNGSVFEIPNCMQEERKLNHAVLVVGYGTDPKDGDYWIVKNSWGDGWGLNGYVLMARNKNNHCGIATMASYPIITE